jgi:hypothetical protein
MGVISCGTTMIDQGQFQNLDVLSWDTTAKTGNFTAVAGNGYFVNTTSAAITVTLPASPSAGDQVGIADYANTANTNNIIINRNGSNVQGTTDTYRILDNGGTIVLLYVDATQGWEVISGAQANNISNPEYIVATGGTITTCGNFKIHTFTSPGTFGVTQAGNTAGSQSVDYLVTSGGGGGGGSTQVDTAGGGGGAGGYRESSGEASGCYTVSPLGCGVGAVSVNVQCYSVTVGGGGAGTVGYESEPGFIAGASGGNSSFGPVSTNGGGRGATFSSPSAAVQTGGSGGGGADFSCTAGAVGNTPATVPPQGNDGTPGRNAGQNSNGAGGGGGGATTDAGLTSAGQGGQGGTGATSSINFSPVGRAGGGGGGATHGTAGTASQGGGAGGTNSNDGTAGTANTGGGGGGAGSSNTGGQSDGGNGGSGVVIIRYKFQ